MVFVRMESDKKGLREMTSKLDPTGWGRLCVPARTAVGAKDGAIASVDLFRGKGLTEKRKVDLGLCPKGNRKPWPDFICELAWSDLCFVEMTDSHQGAWMAGDRKGGQDAELGGLATSRKR